VKLKKKYNNITLFFEIRNDRLILEFEDILTNILESLNDFKFINKEKPFNDLIKEQQKHPKHILVNFNLCVFDELRFIIKVVYNFLIETKQIKYFMIEEMHVKNDDYDIIIYSDECLRKSFESDTSFSPSIRASWSNKPKLIEKILKKA